ncbi:hypothetical protein CTAYLR_009660 [Chrysophaeum taylorii]|uniref:Uncharacterized protein n=1 Tax=Chrysophaeum taylorii TaxID=2483200 RepID=A0AAD7XN86_9STRA|nr:hypothetical protein CTAYLR_009660 [Chrysophaeum taylorii]
MGCSSSVIKGGNDEELSGDETDGELRRLIAKGSLAAAERVVSMEVDLNLSGLALGPRGERALGVALRRPCCVVEVLRLRRCKLIDGKRGLEDLAAGLAANTTVVSIDLRNNGLDDAAVATLAAALSTNTTLRVLNLENNRIGTTGGAGYRALADVLDQSAISELRLGRNGPDGLDAFVVSVEQCKTLGALFLNVGDVVDLRRGFDDYGVTSFDETDDAVGGSAAVLKSSTLAALKTLARRRSDLVVCFDDHDGLRYLNASRLADEDSKAGDFD